MLVELFDSKGYAFQVHCYKDCFGLWRFMESGQYVDGHVKVITDKANTQYNKCKAWFIDNEGKPCQREDGTLTTFKIGYNGAGVIVEGFNNPVYFMQCKIYGDGIINKHGLTLDLLKV